MPPLRHAYTVDELSKILRIGTQALRMWIRSGKIDATKVGRTWVVSAATIESHYPELWRSYRTMARIQRG
jgi:excisionase family DNA binding protein